MNATQISLLLGIITQVIASAPQIAQAVSTMKDLIAALFGAKLITKAQQDALMAYCDANQQMALAGIRPAAWQVEPDPAP
jgi:hypothetical protein